MDRETLIRESRSEDLLQPLGFVTDAGRQRFSQQLRFFTSNVGILQRRQDTILTMRKTLESDPKTDTVLEALFEDIHAKEAEIQTFFTKTQVEKNSYEQLLFSGWPSLQILNTIPFLLLAFAFFKQYIVPALAVFTPLFVLIMPYIVLKYWYRLPLSTDQYTQILMGMVGLQSLDLKNPRAIVQGSLTLFSIVQSVYQPIQTAIHLQTIQQEILQKAQAVQTIVRHMKVLLKSMPSRFQNPLEDLESEDLSRLFASVWDHPQRLRMALMCIGDCEVVYRLAKASRLTPVRLVQGSQPFLYILNGIDPFLSDPVPFTLSLTQNHHSILTGPNKGGKSSVLRSTLLSVVCAQTFGMGFLGSEGSFRLRPFDWIATGLHVEDRPGSQSLFESEVEFAIQILQRATHYPEQIGFVLFDELFHSTNPPDGARTADIFLQKLWNHKTVASFISTHVFDLAKKAHPHIQRLCVPAQKDENGDLTFCYKLQEGICEVSSVDLILKEKGLLSAAKCISGKPEREGGNERVE